VELRTRHHVVLAGLIVVFSADCDSNAPTSQTRKRVFVTTTAFASDLGGLSGADGHCTTIADGSGLRGTFTAWLSDAATDAKDRITGDGPWYLVDRSTLVFSSRPGITLGPRVAINRNENGLTVSDTAVVWTGTADNGTKTSNCNSWSAGGTSGVVGRPTVSGWTASGVTACTNVARLYCLER
jgi:hypothetical protein